MSSHKLPKQYTLTLRSRNNEKMNIVQNIVQYNKVKYLKTNRNTKTKEVKKINIMKSQKLKVEHSREIPSKDQ